MDLHIGDYVFVEKGGEIIPKVTGVDTEKRKGDTKPIVYITKCPECGSKLVRIEGEAAFYCHNTLSNGTALELSIPASRLLTDLSL